MRPISNARAKEKAAGRQGYSGSEKKERTRERESTRQVHHGDTPSIILLREKQGKKGKREKSKGLWDGKRKEEGELSHECCVWSSFMVVRSNSRSGERESFRNGALGSDQISRVSLRGGIIPL